MTLFFLLLPRRPTVPLLSLFVACAFILSFSTGIASASAVVRNIDWYTTGGSRTGTVATAATAVVDYDIVVVGGVEVGRARDYGYGSRVRTRAGPRGIQAVEHDQDDIPYKYQTSNSRLQEDTKRSPKPTHSLFQTLSLVTVPSISTKYTTITELGTRFITSTVPTSHKVTGATSITLTETQTIISTYTKTATYRDTCTSTRTTTKTSTETRTSTRVETSIHSTRGHGPELGCLTTSRGSSSGSLSAAWLT